MVGAAFSKSDTMRWESNFPAHSCDFDRKVQVEFEGGTVMNCTTKSAFHHNTPRLTVTTDELQALLGCGRKSAVDIGELAEARIQLGKRVLWNVEKVKIYLNLISA